MNRTVSQTARIPGVNVQQVKAWATRFKEHLSSQANPPKGRPRVFTDSDVLALMHVCMRWEETPDFENIEAGLNSEDHYDNEQYREMLFLHTPLLEEPPEDLDEIWRHGIFLNGAGVDQFLERARSYKQSADTLLAKLGLRLLSAAYAPYGGQSWVSGDMSTNGPLDSVRLSFAVLTFHPNQTGSLH